MPPPDGVGVWGRLRRSCASYDAGMRVRPSIPLALLLALGATGCTSEPEPEEPRSGGTTSETAPEDGRGGNGWLCEDMSPANLRAVAGGELAEPRELVVADDDTSWVCEAYDGQAPLLRLSVVVGEEGREEARALAAETEGGAAGPDYLGESVIGPRQGVAITLCTDVSGTAVDNDGQEGADEVPVAGDTEGDTRVPYSITAEALGDSEEDVSEALRSTLTLTAGKLDQGFGCSPKAALEEAAQTTEVP